MQHTRRVHFYNISSRQRRGAKDVRVTTRLVDSPACIVVEEGDMSGHLARLLKQAGQSAPASKPILEVNPEHGLVKELDSAEGSERLVTWRRCSSTRRCWPRAGSWRIPPRTCGG